jgi:transglutaminase-like putative cysteine protease
MIRFADRWVTPRIHRLRVPKGTRGTLFTARLIARLMQEGAKDLMVRQCAIEIFRRSGVRPKDRMGEIVALFNFVRRKIRYVRDIWRVETLHAARRVLELKAGDCDDMTILLGAMLLSTGHPVRLILAGFQPTRPHVYTHIYPEVHVRGRWVAIDATVDRPIGWAPPALWKRICDILPEGLRCSCKTD